jgi:hypothetical protein
MQELTTTIICSLPRQNPWEQIQGWEKHKQSLLKVGTATISIGHADGIARARA